MSTLYLEEQKIAKDIGGPIDIFYYIVIALTFSLQIECINHVRVYHTKFHVPFGIKGAADFQNMEHCTP